MDIACVLGGDRREIVEDLPWNDYREGSVGMNPSTIAAGRKSMLDLKHTWDESRPDTDDMLWGRAVHCLLLEPNDFENRYVCWEGRRAGNDYKDFAADAWEKGQEVLTKKRYDDALRAASRFVKDSEVIPLISEGKAEVTVFWPEGNIQCRGRIDWLATSPKRLIDVKTTNDVEAVAFGRTFRRFHYALKLGLYQRWLQKLTGDPWPVDIICLGNRAPYDVTVVPISDAVLDIGVRQGLTILDKLEVSLSTDTWPGVAGGEEYFHDVRPWDMADDDAELEGCEEVNHG